MKLINIVPFGIYIAMTLASPGKSRNNLNVETLTGGVQVYTRNNEAVEIPDAQGRKIVSDVWRRSNDAVEIPDANGRKIFSDVW